MFSVIFPGQGSQMVGMGKEFYDKFDLVKNLFKEADDTLNFSISLKMSLKNYLNYLILPDNLLQSREPVLQVWKQDLQI